MNQKEREKQNAKRYLLEQLEIKPGDEIFTVLRHVSQSGMMRHVSLFYLKENDLVNISYHVSKLIDFPFSDKNNAVKVSGCGTDVGFQTVYNMSYHLFKDGFKCIGDKCQSSDHFNRIETDFHKDGAYALKQSWR